jgi:hypothetical protein
MIGIPSPVDPPRAFTGKSGTGANAVIVDRVRTPAWGLKLAGDIAVTAAGGKGEVLGNSPILKL